MEIKKVAFADITELQDIGIRSYIPHYSYLWKEGGLEWYLELFFALENLQREITDSNIEYYIVAAEKQNIGILKLVLQKPVQDSEIENSLYLEKIYFVKEWTGKGVGQKLMQFVFDRAQELKRDCVWLKAMDTSDKPIAAYQRAGFVVHSRTRLDFDLMKEEFRGMVVMKRLLNKNGN